MDSLRVLFVRRLRQKALFGRLRPRRFNLYSRHFLNRQLFLIQEWSLLLFSLKKEEVLLLRLASRLMVMTYILMSFYTDVIWLALSSVRSHFLSAAMAICRKLLGLLT